MAKWAAVPTNRDRWRLLRSMQDRSPITFADLVPSGRLSEVEYHHLGRPTAGLAAADIIDGIAVSLLVDDAWSSAEISVERTELDEAGNLDRHPVLVRHASCGAHVDTHHNWLVKAGLATVRTGRDLWTMRAEYFPHLGFIPSVEANLTSLDESWVLPVQTLLAKLEASTAQWDPRTQPSPQWSTNVTPEGEQRKLLCWFPDLDGEKRLFDQHARFTPNTGRLHFRLVPELGEVRIGYIGRKLGI